MPCWGAQGIAKQFASGTRFFAHKARSFTCDWKPESEEHLRYKAMAFDAAMAAGAIAETEVRSNPNGPAEWIADVLVTHENIRRVIEIQLAPQSMAETLARTQRYRRAGIDVLWLFRRLPEGMKIGKDLPVIVLPEGDEEYAERVVRIAAAEFATGRRAPAPSPAPGRPWSKCARPHPRMAATTSCAAQAAGGWSAAPGR